MRELKLKKGDAAIVVRGYVGRSEKLEHTTVKSIGKKWITTGAGRFHLNGYGEFGTSLYTAETLREERVRLRADRAIRDAIARIPSTEALVAAATALDPSWQERT